MNKTKTFPGSIGLSRYSGTRQGVEDGFTITINAEHCRVLEVILEPSEIAELISNREAKGTIEAYNNYEIFDKVKETKQNKTVLNPSRWYGILS